MLFTFRNKLINQLRVGNRKKLLVVFLPHIRFCLPSYVLTDKYVGNIVIDAIVHYFRYDLIEIVLNEPVAVFVQYLLSVRVLAFHSELVFHALDFSHPLVISGIVGFYFLSVEDERFPILPIHTSGKIIYSEVDAEKSFPFFRSRFYGFFPALFCPGPVHDFDVIKLTAVIRLEPDFVYVFASDISREFMRNESIVLKSEFLLYL